MEAEERKFVHGMLFGRQKKVGLIVLHSVELGINNKLTEKGRKSCNGSCCSGAV